MALQVNREEIDEFCPKLFRVLDNLGLLPLQLWAKPNEFEKYPRLLFGSIRRYSDVEAGYKDWESRILRESPHRKEDFYLELETLRQWMLQHKGVFTEKANLQHLHTSLYARIFNYLYPRRVIVNAYCVKHQGNVEATNPEFMKKAFPSSIETEVQKLKEVYNPEWENIVKDAGASFLANMAYYRKVLSGEELVDLLREVKEQGNLEGAME